MRERKNYSFVTAWKEAKKIIIKRKLDTACSTVFKNKSIPADRAEICSQTKMGTFTLICITAPGTQILRALGRVLVSIITHSK